MLKRRLLLQDCPELRRALVETVDLPNSVVCMGPIPLRPGRIVHACVCVLTKYIVTKRILYFVLVASDYLLRTKLT